MKCNTQSPLRETLRRQRGQSHLIYPSHLKYDQSRKMPHLAMLDRLKAFLMQPSSAMFIVGYSFSDDHINDVIFQSLRSNPTSIVYVFLYGELEQVKYAKAIRGAKMHSNLSLIAFDKALIGKKIGYWSIKEEDRLNEFPAQVINVEKVKEENNQPETTKISVQFGDFFQFGAFLKEISALKSTGNEKAE